jgi:hypothetical protein
MIGLLLFVTCTSSSLQCFPWFATMGSVALVSPANVWQLLSVAGAVKMDYTYMVERLAMSRVKKAILTIFLSTISLPP